MYKKINQIMDKPSEYSQKNERKIFMSQINLPQNESKVEKKSEKTRDKTKEKLKKKIKEVVKEKVPVKKVAAKKVKNTK
jgi:hypothetical protein